MFGAKSVGKIKVFSWHYHAVLVLMMHFCVITVRHSCLWYIFVSFPCGTGTCDIFSLHYLWYSCIWRIFVSFPCGIRTYDVFSYHYHAVFVRMIYFRVITMRYSYVWCIFVSLPCGTRTYDVFSYHYKVVILFSHLLTYIVTW